MRHSFSRTLLVHFCRLFLAFICTQKTCLESQTTSFTIDLTIMDFSHPIGITHKIIMNMVTNIKKKKNMKMVTNIKKNIYIHENGY